MTFSHFRISSDIENEIYRGNTLPTDDPHVQTFKLPFILEYFCYSFEVTSTDDELKSGRKIYRKLGELKSK